jgi:hypothetical protein
LAASNKQLEIDPQKKSHELVRILELGFRGSPTLARPAERAVLKLTPEID